MSPTRVAFHWSGGKDSSLALTWLRRRRDVDVRCLVTTVHPQRGTSTVHGIPVGLLRAQAASIGLPLRTIPITTTTMTDYLRVMETATYHLREEGIEAFAFGDLAASEVRSVKEQQFGPLGMQVLEPLWELTPRECMDAFLASGIAAVTVVVDADVLGASAVGAALDARFVAAMPSGADVCGENGEYHTFVHDGPLFAKPVRYRLSPLRFLIRDISTNTGRQRYRYWVRPPRGD